MFNLVSDLSMGTGERSLPLFPLPLLIIPTNKTTSKICIVFFCERSSSMNVSFSQSLSHKLTHSLPLFLFEINNLANEMPANSGITHALVLGTNKTHNIRGLPKFFFFRPPSVQVHVRPGVGASIHALSSSCLPFPFPIQVLLLLEGSR